MEQNQTSNNDQLLCCVDLFAGAGGFSLAAIKEGLKVVAAIENDGHAAATYRLNFIEGKADPPKLFEQDIMEPGLIEELQVQFTHRECDLILGGPPCQGFSVHRIKGAGINDKRNDLALRYFDFVESLAPKAFLLENVPGILWERHRSYLDRFYKLGGEAGYQVLPTVVLDARDFGIPQRRKRVFILGVRNDIPVADFQWPPPATHGSPKACSENPQLLPWVNASQVFDKPLDKHDPNNIHMNHTPEIVEVFKSTPPNGGSRRDSGRVLPCHQNYSGHLDVYGRIDPSKPGPTMTTACVNPSKGRFVHPTKHHGITVRHAARFQTFPDDFVFLGGLGAGGRQIGNAVPIDLGRVLLQTISPMLIQVKESLAYV